MYQLLDTNDKLKDLVDTLQETERYVLQNSNMASVI